MSEITILLLYLLAALGFAASRLPRFDAYSNPALIAAFAFGGAGLLVHGQFLNAEIISPSGLILSIESALSLVGLQLALIGLLGATEPILRGMTAGLLGLAALATVPLGLQPPVDVSTELTWQIQAHILTSIFSYGLLAAGAIVAIYALIQDRRLRTGHLSSVNRLFAPLETTEMPGWVYRTRRIATIVVLVVLAVVGLWAVSELASGWGTFMELWRSSRGDAAVTGALVLPIGLSLRHV